MKSTGKLRLLCLLGFLLLIAPFYRQCGAHKIKSEELEERNIDTTIVRETDADTTLIETQTSIKNDTVATKMAISNENSFEPVKNQEIPFYQKVYDYIDDEDSESAFELAYSFINVFNEIFIDDKNEQNWEFYFISMMINRFFFVLIVLISLLMTIFAFRNKLKWVYKLSITSLIFITITLFCFIFLEIGFESYKQIKWGYYTFILDQIAIIIYSRKLLRQEKQLISNKIE